MARHAARTLVPPAGGAAGVTAALSLCLVANLAPIMSFPAVLPKVAAAWGLSAGDAGWIGGGFFAGYAAAVPVLAGATDRVDGRLVVAGASLLGATASLGFAALADGFWLALALRVLGGVALAGVHMPGLKLITERIQGPAQARGASIYVSSYALGSAGSFLVAGLVDAAFGWRAAFIASGVGPLLGLAVLARLGPVPRAAPRASPAADLARVLRDRAFMAYALGFAGNTWEVFGIRVWFVACLAWTQALPGNALTLPNLAVISGLASLAGVPASLAVAELAQRRNPARVIVATCAVSVGVCLALAATAGGPIAIVLPLLVLLQITSFADVGALGAGAIARSDPARRGSALAIYALAGFTTGFFGPAAFGLVLDWCGGPERASAWSAAFLTLALGSTAAGVAVSMARENRPSTKASSAR